MNTPQIKITKVGGDNLAPPSVKAESVSSKPNGARRKTMRTFPRGVLKIKPVADPAKPPPLRKTAKRNTIAILTEKGAKRHRKTIKNKVDSLSNEKVKQLVEKKGLLKNKNTPVSLMRHMVEGAAVAGFISLD